VLLTFDYCPITIIKILIQRIINARKKFSVTFQHTILHFSPLANFMFNVSHGAYPIFMHRFSLRRFNRLPGGRNTEPGPDPNRRLLFGREQ